MKIERPGRHGTSPLPSVERLRSNISSRLPAKIHRGGGGGGRGAAGHHHHHGGNDYNLSYRRPLLSEEWEHSEGFDEEEEEVDDVTPLTPGSSSEGGRFHWKTPGSAGSGRSPRTPGSAVSTTITKPVKKVLSAVTSLRSNHSPKHVDYYHDDDDMESRNDEDDDHQHLLRSMYDKDFMGDRNYLGFGSEVVEPKAPAKKPAKQLIQHPVKQPTAQPIKQPIVNETVIKDTIIKDTINLPPKPQQQHHHVRGGSVGSMGSVGSRSMKSFKQLHEDEDSGHLRVVDFGGCSSSGSSTSSDDEVGMGAEEVGSASSDKENAELVIKMAEKEEEEQVSAEDSMKQSIRLSSDLLEKIQQGSARGLDGRDLEHTKPRPPLRMSTSESLIGLKISQLSSSERGSDISNNGMMSDDKASQSNHSEALAKSMQASSIFGYSTASDWSEKVEQNQQQKQQQQQDGVHETFVNPGHPASSAFEYSDDTSPNAGTDDDDDLSVGSLGSSSTIDLDSHLTLEEKINGVPTDDGLASGNQTAEATALDENLKTPVESSVAATEGQQSYITYATYARHAPYPVTVTPTENGDVIVLTPLDDIVDIGPQPQAQLTGHETTPPNNSDNNLLTPQDDAVDIGPPLRALPATRASKPRQEPAQALGSQPKPALLIPTLGGEINHQDNGVYLDPNSISYGIDQQKHEARVDASKIETIYTRKKVAFPRIDVRDYNEVSPAGVDELVMSDDEFTEVNFVVTEEQVVATSKPPLAPSREDSEFIASEGWDDDEEEGSVGNSSQPFGSFEVHEDALRDILMDRDPRVIELRGSLESDCGQSGSVVSSVVSSTVAQDFDVDNDGIDKSRQVQAVPYLEKETAHSLLDVAIDEDSKESKDTCSSMGSFSQIYTKGSLQKDDQESDSEDSDAPDYYFEVDSVEKADPTQKEEGSFVEDEAENFDLLDTGDESKECMVEHGYQRSLSRNSITRPWNRTDSDSESDCHASDLISVPSASFSSSSNQEDGAPPVPHEVAREVEQLPDADDQGRADSAPDVQDYDNLNSFWLNQWTEMSEKAEGRSFDEEASIDSRALSDPDVDQPHFLLKKDFGDAMTEDDEEKEETQRSYKDDNICTDCDGNTYLKIFDIDSGRETYEVIQRSFELETVNECSSEEEEDDVEDDRQQGKKPDENKRGKNEPQQDEPQKPKPSESKNKTIDEIGRVNEAFVALEKPVSKPHHKQQHSLVSLEELHSLFDEYQATINHDCAEPQVATLGLENLEITTSQPQLLSGLEFRRAKSSKKRHLHIKKRAIAKAKSEKTKYNLAYLEKGSHHEKKAHHRSSSKDSIEQHPTAGSLILNNSFDITLSNALEALAGREKNNEPDEHATRKIHKEMFSPEDYKHFFSSYAVPSADTKAVPAKCESNPTESRPRIEDTPQFQDDDDSSIESVTPKPYKDYLISSKDASPTTSKENDYLLVPTLEDTVSPKNEDDHSLNLSTTSLDTFASMVIADETGEKDDLFQSPKTVNGASTAPAKSQFHPSQLEKGTSFIFTNLYSENIELAEALSATQSELQKVTRKLESVLRERDEMAETARFEI